MDYLFGIMRKYSGLKSSIQPQQNKYLVTFSSNRMSIIGLAACWFLLNPGPVRAQFYGGAASSFGDELARDCSVNISLWQTADKAQGADLTQSVKSGDDQNQSQKQAGPQSQEPSLKDLGFPSDVTKGNAQEQARLDRRSHMLQIHQRLGLITVAPMLITLFTSPGAKGHHGLPGSASGREWHAAFGAATAGLYFSSAYFAIHAPKIPDTHVEGPIRLHKALAWIHGPGMILTPILGEIAYSQLSRGERVHGIAKYHSDVAVVTAAAYAGAILSVSLKF